MHNIINKNGFISERGGTNSLHVDVDSTFVGTTTISGSLSVPQSHNVLHVEIGGNDVIGNGSITTPYATITKACAVASASTPTIDNTWGILVGAGTFIESEINVPPYSSIYGLGPGTTKISASSVASSVVNLNGVRTRLENLTVVGMGTGSANVGVNINTGICAYIETPRVQNVTIRGCEIGTCVTSGSTATYFNVRSFDNRIGYCASSSNEVDIYVAPASRVRSPAVSEHVTPVSTFATSFMPNRMLSPAIGRAVAADLTVTDVVA
jgi:hypothetical protein